MQRLFKRVEAANMVHKELHNDELIDLLFTEEDRLPKGAAIEIVRRGEELTPDLARITMDKFLWNADLPDWWAPVHATYLLGSIGSEETITPLLAALRWSDAYNNEWVVDELPSIFGKIGLPAMKPLERIVAERSAGWSARAIAMEGLAATVLKERELEEKVVRMIAAILDDPTEELGARRAAVTILLDLRRADCKDALISFLAQDEKRFKDDPVFGSVITSKEAEKTLAITKRDTEHYLSDWMNFYEADEIRARQKRWAEEDARHRTRLKH